MHSRRRLELVKLDKSEVASILQMLDRMAVVGRDNCKIIAVIASKLETALVNAEQEAEKDGDQKLE